MQMSVDENASIHRWQTVTLGSVSRSAARVRSSAPSLNGPQIISLFSGAERSDYTCLVIDVVVSKLADNVGDAINYRAATQ
ncbi:hypothetical protein BgiBS90_009954 [Biomphalaria glabrata]|nr:hypothetical protein BgiBS90_009954 [Biomphalaria glabrata]